MLVEAHDLESELRWAVCEVNISKYPMEGKIVSAWMGKANAEKLRKEWKHLLVDIARRDEGFGASKLSVT